MLLKLIASALLNLLVISSIAQTLDKKEKAAIFKNSKEMLSKHYHFKDQVKPIINFLDQRWNSGYYGSISNRNDFTTVLANDMKSVANDQHLNFFYTPAHLAKNTPSAPMMNMGLINEKFLNNGLNALEILEGDIGYMRLQAFGSFEDLLPSAFTFLSNTQALIIDLRGNGGGMPSNYVSSYLLPQDSIHLVTIYWNDHTDSLYTQRNLKGPRYLDKPVYLLTDRGTFSSAEEFAYDLQALQRVTIVGENTGGGANPGGLMPIYTFNDGSRIEMFVSLAHVENAITKANWEGRGVQPEIPVKGEDALKKAHYLIIDYLIKNEPNEPVKNQYRVIRKKIGL
jgi:retinol-binding protein 3